MQFPWEHIHFLEYNYLNTFRCKKKSSSINIIAREQYELNWYGVFGDDSAPSLLYIHT